MLEFVLKKVISLAITLLTIYVPKEENQKALDSMPSMADRLKGKNLNGWEVRKVPSSINGEMHYYFYCSSINKNPKTLVCLHGFNTDGSVFFNLNGLKDQYNIIAYNFPERSEFYHGAITDFRLLIEDFCTALHLDTIELLGNSIGGGVAINVAANSHTVKIKKLILSSTTVFGATEDSKRMLQGMADKLLKYPDYKLYYLLQKGKAILNQVGAEELGTDVPEEAIVIKHVDWYKQILKSFYWYDGTWDAKHIRSPVILLHGGKDKLLSATNAEKTKELIKQAQWHLYPDAGHSLILSESDRIVALLKESNQK
jgi:pimeloyl-ACP methyl ester carboxylesterase